MLVILLRPTLISLIEEFIRLLHLGLGNQNIALALFEDIVILILGL